MKRLVPSLLAALAFAFPGAAEELTLEEISEALNAIGQAETEFTQFNADGSVSTGRLMLHRPGRMRFEYDKPDDLLVIAGGGTVAIFDGKKDARPESYPLRRTPLNLILARDVNLSASDMVLGRSYDGEATTILAQDPEHPEYGTIALRFGDEPVRLMAWQITNEFGEQTAVELGELSEPESLSSVLFNVREEIRRRK